MKPICSPYELESMLDVHVKSGICQNVEGLIEGQSFGSAPGCDRYLGNDVNMVDDESFMRTQVGACALLVLLFR